MDNNIRGEKDRLIVECLDSNIQFDVMEKREFNDAVYDEIGGFNLNGSGIKVTKRSLENGDRFLYFEISNPVNNVVEIILPHINMSKELDLLYEKPDYDSRYGENKVSGLKYYLKLDNGSAIVSKLYYYKKLETTYDNGDKSSLLEFEKEDSDIKIGDDKVSFEINSFGENVSFFILISDSLLFNDVQNLDKYLEFYYKGVKNNSVWNSYFMHPSGTNTKLPYSIEPFTEDGYGYSLHHSSKRELIPFFTDTKERFFYDMIYNAILQAVLYQKKDNNVFFSPYTSTWLKKETGITAPYMDTRLNEWFIMLQKEFYPFHDGAKIDSEKGFTDFLIEYKEGNERLYSLENGYFFPDYLKKGLGKITHASLNHQLSVALIFKSMYDRTNEKKYLDVFNGMMDFVKNTRYEWISPNGDLYYSVKYNEDNELVFYDKDYVFVTLIDLLKCQKEIMSLYSRQSVSINTLIFSKIRYLLNSDYDISGKEDVIAQGEPVDSGETVKSLYREIYGEEIMNNKLLNEQLEENQKLAEKNAQLRKQNKDLVSECELKIKENEKQFECERARLEAEHLQLKQEFENEQDIANQKIADLKGKLEQKTSHFLYEQKKAEDFRQKYNELDSKLKMYSKSKLFRLMLWSWKVSSNVKFKTKHFLYKTAHWIYVKLMPYPKLRALCSKINGKLRIFKNPQRVVTYTGDLSKVKAENVAAGSKKLKRPKALNVAMVVDEFTFNSFRYECNPFPVEPQNWLEIFQKNDIDLFFCESAWSGVDSERRPWKGQVYSSINFAKENRTALLDILEYCKKKGIPTVFWNKEDPTHYPDKVHNFVDTALKFDHIFTTSKECVERYKGDYGHKSVHCLMFATQPKLFNPIEKFERTNEIIFAGSWYNQHPQRCEEMEAIFDNILQSGYELKIYDRHYGTDDPNRIFPERFQKYLNPSLRHDQLDAAYKGSQSALNINTVTDSDTMFARRVFELMSSNTYVLSNYSKGMEDLFGDNVLFVGGNEKIEFHDIEKKKEWCLYDVLKNHTYKSRFEQILNDISYEYEPDKASVCFIYQVTDQKSCDKYIRHFSEMNWKNKKAILYVKKETEADVLRKIVENYQSTMVSVISEKYCLDYEDVLQIDSDYFSFADETMSVDFINKAILHYEYIEETVGIVEGQKKYSFCQDEGYTNVLFSSKMLEDVKAVINNASPSISQKYTI